MCVNLYTYMCVHLYTYMYICIYTYICIEISIQDWGDSFFVPRTGITGSLCQQRILLYFTWERLFIIFPVYFGYPMACFCNVSRNEEDVGLTKCSWANVRLRQPPQGTLEWDELEHSAKRLTCCCQVFCLFFFLLGFVCFTKGPCSNKRRLSRHATPSNPPRTPPNPESAVYIPQSNIFSMITNDAAIWDKQN